MKNAWTQARMLAGILLVITLASGCTHTGPRHSSSTTHTRAADDVADPATQKLAERPEIQSAPLRDDDLAGHMQADPPLRYVVKRGDTLWAIAGYYLDDPWYWSQLWDANPDIANPHRIYPGDVLVLRRGIDGQPRLSSDRTEHLSPRVREQPLTDAIPVIPFDAIRDFIDSPQLVDADQLDAAPYVVSFDDEHLVAGKGALVYLRGVDPDGPSQYQIVRHDGPYRDGATGEILGEEALPVGQITITHAPAADAPAGDAIATGVIETSNREALVGDRLLPVTDEVLIHNFYPQAPAGQVATQIISVYGGVTAIGQYDVVTLDRGADDGLTRGDVLNVFQTGRNVADPVAGGSVTLPAVYAGQLMVFKTESRVSFALIMSARRAIHVEDVARSPRT